MKYVDKIKGEESADEIQRTWSLEISKGNNLQLLVETPCMKSCVVSIDLSTGVLRRCQEVHGGAGLWLDGDKAIVVGSNV